jgi:acetoacetate decarboxylase
MTEDEVKALAYAMPISNPLYPRPPFRFLDHEFVTISYRTDPDSIARIVPAPLLPAEPVVRFDFISMPASRGLGPCTATTQVIPATFNGERGDFVHAMYLDNEARIASGREFLGFPIMVAQPRLELRTDTLVGTLDYNGVRVATATMAYKHQSVDTKSVERTLATPGLLLKIMPHVDGSTRICELVKYYMTDLVVKGAWTGPASLETHTHHCAQVAKLPIDECLSGTHFLVDLTISKGEVVHDYLPID